MGMYSLPALTDPRYTLNICTWKIRVTKHVLTIVGDVGGQRSLRPYWRNYFEKTDAIVWVVDSSDAARMDDCRKELWCLLGEEVRLLVIYVQHLSGVSILILANKQDLPGSLTPEQCKEVCHSIAY